MIYIYCTCINETQWSEIHTQVNILNITDQKAIAQYKFDKDKCRSLLGKMLLLYILKHHEDYHSNQLPPITYTTYRKPFISTMQGYFNISHAADWVVCAYTQEGDLGVDIEKAHSIDIDDYKAVMTPNEYLRATHHNDFDFFQLWTLKEAIMKAEGLGFYLPPTSFEIPHPFSNNTNIHINKDWFLFSQCFKQHYTLSIASSCLLNEQPQVIIQPIDQLLVSSKT